MVLVEKSNFLSSLFFCKSSQTRSFLDILDKKVCFLDQKKEVLKITKKLKFSIGVSPQFLSKNQTFYHLCFLDKSSHKKSFFENPVEKECFWEQKKEVFRKSNQWKFFKGVSPWFWSKNRPFLCMFFGHVKQEKIVFWYSD